MLILYLSWFFLLTLSSDELDLKISASNLDSNRLNLDTNEEDG